jgi:hypothetical protein
MMVLKARQYKDWIQQQQQYKDWIQQQQQQQYMV